jgi:hypothetical protein
MKTNRRNCLAGLLGLAAAVFSTGSAVAQDQGDDLPPPKAIHLSIARAYLPAGFDNNDMVRIMVEGLLPNSCIEEKQVDRSDIRIDHVAKVIEIRQRAYDRSHESMCLMRIVPYKNTVEVGVIPNFGSYQIKDATTESSLGKLSVKQAKKSDGSGVDDHFYAIVHGADYVTSSRGPAVRLRGELLDSCWSLTDVRAFQDGVNVVTILPVMKQTSATNCGDHRIPFEREVLLPSDLRQGRYMFQVRSLNGQSVTNLFDLL